MRGNLRNAWTRLSGSTVVWSWTLNGFRLASGLLLLPLLIRVLPKPDFGMYYVFLSLVALLPIIDCGFSVSIARYISYAMGGATDLVAEGLIAKQTPAPPNFGLLWRLLGTTRKLFRYLSVLTFLVLGLGGTYAVNLRVQETSSPQLTWLAWGVTLFSAILEIYSGWWNIFLRGMNEVLLSARISVLAQGVKILLAAILLLMGAGLLALPLAGLASSLLQRQLARQKCLRRLGSPPVPSHSAWVEASLLPILWPTSWRTGLQFFSTYLATNANAIICAKIFGLAANAEYGLTIQITSIIQGTAMVWTSVKWPLVGQYRAQNESIKLQKVLWPRYWLQAGTFLILGVAAFLLGPALLRWQGANKEMLPPILFALVLLNSFFELHFSFWTTLLSMGNRIPSLWPTVATNILSLTLVFALLHFTSLGLGALVLSPFIAGCLFNYWYWLLPGARSLGTSWWRFVLCRP